jgi:hypothetical protein
VTSLLSQNHVGLLATRWKLSIRTFNTPTQDINLLALDNSVTSKRILAKRKLDMIEEAIPLKPLRIALATADRQDRTSVCSNRPIADLRDLGADVVSIDEKQFHCSRAVDCVADEFEWRSSIDARSAVTLKHERGVVSPVAGISAIVRRSTTEAEPNLYSIISGRSSLYSCNSAFQLSVTDTALVATTIEYFGRNETR